MKNEKDTSVIPKGPYCYTYDEAGEYKLCPYWDTIKGVSKQYNGYCSYLEKGDMDLEQEMELTDMKTGEKIKGDKLPFPVSLLWDQCKECGINKEDEYEDE
ncbi:MAG: hypothetical protein WC554_18520 [Clostridia bacterium]